MSQSIYAITEMFRNASDFEPVLTCIVFWAQMSSSIKQFQKTNAIKCIL